MPLLRARVDAIFAERVKALLKPDGAGVFVFKGMSADEDGFRQVYLGAMKRKETRGNESKQDVMTWYARRTRIDSLDHGKAPPPCATQQHSER